MFYADLDTLLMGGRCHWQCCSPAGIRIGLEGERVHLRQHSGARGGISRPLRAINTGLLLVRPSTNLPTGTRRHAPLGLQPFDGLRRHGAAVAARALSPLPTRGQAPGTPVLCQDSWRLAWCRSGFFYYFFFLRNRYGGRPAARASVAVSPAHTTRVCRPDRCQHRRCQPARLDALKNRTTMAPLPACVALRESALLACPEHISATRRCPSRTLRWLAGVLRFCFKHDISRKLREMADAAIDSMQAPHMRRRSRRERSRRVHVRDLRQANRRAKFYYVSGRSSSSNCGDGSIATRTSSASAQCGNRNQSPPRRGRRRRRRRRTWCRPRSARAGSPRRGGWCVRPVFGHSASSVRSPPESASERARAPPLRDGRHPLAASRGAARQSSFVAVDALPTTAHSPCEWCARRSRGGAPRAPGRSSRTRASRSSIGRGGGRRAAVEHLACTDSRRAQREADGVRRVAAVGADASPVVAVRAGACTRPPASRRSASRPHRCRAETAPCRAAGRRRRRRSCSATTSPGDAVEPQPLRTPLMSTNPRRSDLRACERVGKRCGSIVVRTAGSGVEEETASGIMAS